MNKYARAISSNMIYFLINTLYFLVITRISIHIMGSELFGLWSILNAIVFLTSVGTLGIGSIVTKFAAEMHEGEITFRNHSSEVISAGILIIFPMSIITAFLFASLRYFIASNLDINLSLQRQFSVALLIVSGGVFPQFLSRVSQGFLLSQFRNGLVRRIETTYLVLLWGGAVLIVLYEKNLILMAIWCLLDAVLLFVMYFFALRRITKFSFRINAVLIKRMLGFSGFMFIESVAVTMFQHLDRVIVGIVLGPAIAGVYAVGTSVGLRLSIITGQVTDVMIPYASLKNSLNDNLNLFAAFRKLSKYIGLLVAISGGVLILWMNEILSLWISHEYASSYSNLFRIFIIGYGLLSLSRPAHQTLTGIGKVKTTSFIYSVSTIGTLVSLYFLSNRLGFFGAALANAMAVLLLSMNLYTYKRLSGRVALKELIIDLKWGVILPIFVFALVLLEPIFWEKMLLTILLGTLVSISLFRDDWAQPWLINIARRMANKLTSYA